MIGASSRVVWEEEQQSRVVALNVTGRYVMLAAELGLGLVMLPFNTRHLGTSDYGLWVLAASIVAYFPVLDLGYGAAMERFVAHYRHHRKPDAISEIASTLVFILTAIGLAAFVAMTGIAWNLGPMFGLDARQARTGGLVMLFVAAQFTLGLPFAVFGAIVNGFQRTYLNAAIGTVVGLSVAAVNVLAIRRGASLVQLVGAMTAVRVAGFLAYRISAYRVFPLLRIRLSLFRKARLRDLTRYSVFMMIQDASCKLNYATDPIVIATFLTTGAVAVWTVGQRLADVVLQLTNQLNYVLFPIVVGCDSAQRDDRLRDLLVQGTRLSLATTLPVAGGLALLAEPVVIGWTGHPFAGAVTVVRILAVVVLVRVGSWTASIVLQGAGHHRLVAISNLAAATANVALSVVLVRTHGLPGVAFATLLMVTLRAVMVLMPVACRRVGISVGRFITAAIWPAVWPAVVVLGGLWLVRGQAGTSLFHAVLLGAAAGVVSAGLFVGLAIDRADRVRYFGKLRSIARWQALEAA
jgi:O-antigen/teichoic acid export membrane protein